MGRIGLYRNKRLLLYCSFILLTLVTFGFTKWLAPNAKAQFGTPVGAPLPGMTAAETQSFNTGSSFFIKPWDPVDGLGPVFTAQGCSFCHNIPFGGGNGQNKITLFGTTNADGSFNPLTNEGGPLLQVGTVAAFIGSQSCQLSGEVIPANATITAKRQTPNLFGAGLIDAIPDATILAEVTTEVNDPTDQSLGIHGVANMTLDNNGNLRPGRFGLKAQRPTLVQLVADAFQHDVGITNPLNPNEDLPQGNPIPAGCAVAKSNPNDQTGFKTVTLFQFVEFLAPHAQSPLTASGLSGQRTFNNIGCANCHIPSIPTGSSVTVPLQVSSTGATTKSETSAALSNQIVNLYSDLLLHDMGPALADNIPQGQATGRQWRTTPLWGLSLKTLYLHDGRTANLTLAIKTHGGEASTVINNFNLLSAQDQTNLLTFLNSL